MTRIARWWVSLALATGWTLQASPEGGSALVAGTQPSSEVSAARETAQGKPGAKSPICDAIPEIAVTAPTGTNRVTAAAVFLPSQAAPGDEVTLFVRVRVAPGHWIYAPGKSDSANLPTALENSWPVVFHRFGAWTLPEPKVKSGARILMGDVLFQRRVQVEESAAGGQVKLPLKLTYQVCNEALCWPPAYLNLAADLEIKVKK